MRRIVVGVDPPGSKNTEAGIVAVGEGVDNHIYVLADRSLLGSPKTWAGAAVWLYHELEADRLVAESNYGGSMVRATIEEVDENVSYKDVVATRGKIIRAEPICAMFEKGHAHIVGEMPKLEDELCSYVKGETKSPNRLDGMVWAATEIIVGGSLGFIDYLKSGKASNLGVKVAVPISKSYVAKVGAGKPVPVDDIPKCEKCQWTVLGIVGGGGLRCQNCGHQQFPKGSKPNLPLGGRRIFVR